MASGSPDRPADQQRLAASPVGYLRIYEPLAAYPPAEREWWERYVAAGRAPTRLDGPARERRSALQHAIAPSLDVGGGEQAFVQRVDGLLLVCPWRTQVRVWQAAQEFRSGLPGRVAAAFLPPLVADSAQVKLDDLSLSHPDLKTHIRSATWVIPLAWFVSFDPSERLLVVDSSQGGAGAGSARSLTYSTGMSAARRRVARALGVLRRTLPDAPSVEGLETLGRWLEDFHPHSRLELDYGGIVDVLSDEELREETSVADVAESLAALQRGDGPAAGEAYERLLTRWRVLAVARAEQLAGHRPLSRLNERLGPRGVDAVLTPCRHRGLRRFGKSSGGDCPISCVKPSRERYSL